VQIGLGGTGFLFLGFPDAQANSGGMSFKTKETRDGKTWFTFQALKLGTYDLDFLQQDNTNGSSARETVRVHVVSDQDFNAAVSSAQAVNASSSASPEAGDPGFADRLSGAGAYEAAVTELLKGYQEGNPDLNDRIARLYLLMGSYEAAAKYYQKNLTPPGPLADAAVLGLVRVAAAQRDQVGLMAQLKRLLLIKDPAAEEPLILAMRLERDRAQVGVGLDLAAEYLTRYPDGQWRDEAEFTAAQLLEADSPFRDIAKARDFYRDVVSRYPVGDFAAPARERLQYIERHFYQIR
jgi:tetratricopeptide (TPR) repeat protein